MLFSVICIVNLYIDPTKLILLVGVIDFCLFGFIFINILGIMDNAPNYHKVVSMFEIQWLYHVFFWPKIVGENMNSFIFRAIR